jgi:DNA ligase-1
MSKAIQQVSGLTPTALKRLYNTTGDVGDVAFEAKSNIRTLVPHPPLLINTVFDFLIKISRAKGQGAAKFKQNIVEKLLVAARGEETRFLARTLSMNLRVGAVRTSILTALARAMVLTPPGTLTVPIPPDSPYHATSKLVSEVTDLPGSAKAKSSPQGRARNEVNEKFGRAESLLKRVFVQHPNYDHIVAALLDVGLDGIAERVPLAVGTSAILFSHIENS